MQDRLEGINSIGEALKAGREIRSIYLSREKLSGDLQQVVAMAQKRGIPVFQVDRGSLNHMTGSNSHQGIVAEVEPYRYYAVEDLLLEAEKRGEPPLLLLLDGIEDPQNLGAIIRTAEGLGAHGVIIAKHHACAITPAVIRASAGAAEHMKVARVTNLIQVMKELQQKGVWVVGTDAGASESCFQFSFPDSVVLVVGSEGRGMRRLVRKECDHLVKVPMLGQINSLNASVATAIVLYEVIRQRESVKESD